MSKAQNKIVEVDELVINKKNKFLKNLSSDMFFNSHFSGDSITFEWLDKIEFACPYLDNIVRNPKLALIKESMVVKIEKSKKITVDSIKDLSRHTNYISKYDEKENYVEPSKILNVLSEETYNIYENRFLYTLIRQIDSFIYKKEEELKNFKLSDSKLLEYSGCSKTANETVNIELRLSSESIPNVNTNNKLQEEIKVALARIKRIKDYLNSWNRSVLFTELEKEHISFVKSPIKKTNVILKNPNFQIAIKLWDFLQKYGTNDKKDSVSNIDQMGKNPLQDFIDHSFMIDYFVLDSISKTKREQKEKMSKYAVLLLTEEIKRLISLLFNVGINVDEEELLNMVIEELKKGKNYRLVGVDDVKKKFKNAMEEYLERTQDYL